MAPSKPSVLDKIRKEQNERRNLAGHVPNSAWWMLTEKNNESRRQDSLPSASTSAGGDGNDAVKGDSKSRKRSRAAPATASSAGDNEDNGAVDEGKPRKRRHTAAAVPSAAAEDDDAVEDDGKPTERRRASVSNGELRAESMPFSEQLAGRANDEEDGPSTERAPVEAGDSLESGRVDDSHN